MIRPGHSVNTPATSKAPMKSHSITRRCWPTAWRLACRTPTGNSTSVKSDRPWITLNGPSWHSVCIQKDDSATTAIRATQIQPIARCGKVPFGSASCATPSRNAAIAASAWRITCGAAVKRGTSVMSDLRFQKSGWFCAKFGSGRNLVQATQRPPAPGPCQCRRAARGMRPLASRTPKIAMAMPNT